MDSAGLTIVTVPKAFSGHFATIQENAVRSWQALGPNVEVILMGTDAGVAETAGRMGARHVAEIRRSRWGTPLVSDAIEIANGKARYETLCVVNADIILMEDFLPALDEVRAGLRRYVMIGRRCDLDVTESLDTGSVACARALRRRANTGGVLRSGQWIDYFVFPRGEIESLPDLAIGRPGWDNWFLWHARRKGLPLVDVTPRVLAVHQNHDYSHHAQGYKGAWEGPEARAHVCLTRGKRAFFTMDNATHVLTPEGLQSRRLACYRVRIRQLVNYSWHRAVGSVLDCTRPIRRKLGLSRHRNKSI